MNCNCTKEYIFRVGYLFYDFCMLGAELPGLMRLRMRPRQLAVSKREEVGMVEEHMSQQDGEIRTPALCLQ